MRAAIKPNKAAMSGMKKLSESAVINPAFIDTMAARAERVVANSAAIAAGKNTESVLNAAMTLLSKSPIAMVTIADATSKSIITTRSCPIRRLRPNPLVSGMINVSTDDMMHTVNMAATTQPIPVGTKF